MRERLRRGPLLAAAVALAALAVFAAAVAVPWATRAGEQPASVPTPPALLELEVAPVAPGEVACTSPAVVESHSQVAAFRVRTPRGSGPPLDVRIRGGGYETGGRVPGGYADGPVYVDLGVPPRAPVVTEVCVRNAGAVPVALELAGDERTRTRSQTTVDGALVEDLALAFYERRHVSVARRLPTTVERLTVFRPDAVAEPVVWLLLVLVLVGTPLLAAGALAAAGRRDGR